MLFRFVIVFLTVLVAGCAHPERQPPVPPQYTTAAQIPNLPDVRFWPLVNLDPYVRMGLEGVKRERAYLARKGHRGALPPASYLALSGGGDDGAFGAGLLIGWSEHGSRPTFKTVTGVSTGALIAPFAFLGSRYDHALRTVYTSISSKDILRRRNIFAVINNDALADSAPMFKLISRFVTPELLREIAEEYRKGRFLLIATTDIDARQPVIWNMGAIAETGTPQALNLFRRLLTASASIPAAFPPVMIDVEVDSKKYQEMHVDGGAVAQIFAYPSSPRISRFARSRRFRRKRTLYLIRNARLDPQWATVKRQTLDIAGKAISTMIMAQGYGDLVRLYLMTQRDGFGYRLAYIPKTFKAVHREEFDTVYMRKLFDYAYRLARKGYPWAKRPPVSEL